MSVQVPVAIAELLSLSGYGNVFLAAVVALLVLDNDEIIALTRYLL